MPDLYLKSLLPSLLLPSFSKPIIYGHSTTYLPDTTTFITSMSTMCPATKKEISIEELMRFVYFDGVN